MHYPSGVESHINSDRFFKIGFPKIPKEELEDLKDLKKCLADIVQCSGYLTEKILPVYAIFEQIFIRNKKKKIISRETLSNNKDKLSTEQFRINDEEISKMLEFFHRVGSVLYFKEDNLKDYIILDTQWFLEAFKCIIQYPLHVTDTHSKRKHFYETGELEEEELKRIWTNETNFWDHKSTIVAYMGKLGLLTECKSNIQQSKPAEQIWYYVPSMNKRKFNENIGHPNDKSSILCFKFDDKGQLPFYVFYGIVGKCCNIPGWSIWVQQEQKCIYENAAYFSFEEHILVLCICNYQIQMQVWWCPAKKDPKLLKKLKESLENILKEYTKYSYKVGYKCQNGVLNSKEDNSFIDESEVSRSDVFCKWCKTGTHLVNNNICWVSQKYFQYSLKSINYNSKSLLIINVIITYIYL